MTEENTSWTCGNCGQDTDEFGERHECKVAPSIPEPVVGEEAKTVFDCACAELIEMATDLTEEPRKRVSQALSEIRSSYLKLQEELNAVITVRDQQWAERKRLFEENTKLQTELEEARLEGFTDGLMYAGLFPTSSYTPDQIREMAPRALELLLANKPSEVPQ